MLRQAVATNVCFSLFLHSLRLQTLIKHSLNSTHEEYNFDQFQDLMGSLDDRVTKIRKTQFYPCKYTQGHLLYLTLTP